MPHKSHPLHFSGCTTCGGWYPLELKADDSASTCVGQNSTQKPQALQRSTTIETRPFATRTPSSESRLLRCFNCGGCDYAGEGRGDGVMAVTERGEEEHDSVFCHPSRKLPVSSRLPTFL